MEYNRSTMTAVPIKSMDSDNGTVYYSLAQLGCSNITNLYGVEVAFYGDFNTRPDITVIVFNNCNACNEYLTSLASDFEWPKSFIPLDEDLPRPVNPVGGSIANYVVTKKTIATDDETYPGWPAPMAIPGSFYNPNIIKPYNAGQVDGYTGAKTQGCVHVVVLYSANPIFADGTKTIKVPSADGTSTEEFDICDIAILYGKDE